MGQDEEPEMEGEAEAEGEEGGWSYWQSGTAQSWSALAQLTLRLELVQPNGVPGALRACSVVESAQNDICTLRGAIESGVCYDSPANQPSYGPLI